MVLEEKIRKQKSLCAPNFLLFSVLPKKASLEGIILSEVSHRSIFMMTALKSSSNNSNIPVIVALVSIIFVHLVWGLLCPLYNEQLLSFLFLFFFLNPRHLGIMLWDSRTYLNVHFFFWPPLTLFWQGKKRGPPHHHQGRVEVQVSHLAFVDMQGGAPLHCYLWVGLGLPTGTPLTPPLLGSPGS